MTLAETLQKIGRPRVLVLGDLVLDRYTSGNAERVSPEAPVLVLAAENQEARLGGAASVAGLLRGLDASVALAGVLGDDQPGGTLRGLLDEQGIDQTLVLCDRTRRTTTKERFLGRAGGRSPHQVLRVDWESREPLEARLEERLLQAVVRRLSDYQVVLISDYAKGVCTPRLLEKIIAAAKGLGLPVLVDPARIADYSRYRGATVLVPNRTETSLATGRTVRTPEDAIVCGRQLLLNCRTEAVVVKLDCEGMVYVTAGAGEHASTGPREVHDVTGAGDMVLAMLGLCQGAPLPEAVRLANVAAGLEVQRLGVVPISRDEIRAELGVIESTPEVTGRAKQLARDKLVTLDEMSYLAEVYRRVGKKIVLTNGCFDLLHAGHAAYLEEASRLGDVLVVAVNSDRSVRALKGPGRPVLPERNRAGLLASLSVVDHVLVFDEDTPHKVLRYVRPDVLAKGGDYTPSDVIGREVVLGYGGKVQVMGKVEGVSTSEILASVCREPANSEKSRGGHFSELKSGPWTC